MESSVPPPHVLHRTLGPVEVLFLTLSALTPAASVFIYGGAILHLAGTGTALAVLIGGVVAATCGLLYAELGAAFPQAGGIYPSVVGVLGPFWAFPYISMMMLLAPGVVAFSVLGFSDYVRFLVPAWPQIPIALVCLALACGVAMLSVRTGALVTGVFLLIEAMALVVLTAVAMTHPARSLATVIAHPVVLDHGAMQPVAPAILGLALVSGVYTTGGASWAMYFGEELKDAPRRIGPLIVAAGVLAAVTIAGPLALMVLSARDLPAILGADAPVAAYIASAGGRGLAAAVSASLVIAIFNAIVAVIMSFSRLYYATGRDGVWPQPINRALAYLHCGMRSPMVATATVGVGAGVMLFLGERALLILTSGQNIVEYLLVAAAVVLGRKLMRTGLSFRAPLHPLAPLVAVITAGGCIVAEWCDPAAGRPSLLVLAAVVGGSLVYYRLRLRRREGGWGVVEPAVAIEPVDLP